MIILEVISFESTDNKINVLCKIQRDTEIAETILQYDDIYQLPEIIKNKIYKEVTNG